MIGKKLSTLANEGTTSIAPDYIYGEAAGISVTPSLVYKRTLEPLVSCRSA